ncbi:unnamed protein product [Mytilus edulis]|uniref:Uncharacterized protein n=1 Tax=Mytilus edulis TaxID=6550 RepID=A0A8S3UYJ2_MYTED|nr:unnamed protein product [Mytilus edulis]
MSTVDELEQGGFELGSFPECMEANWSPDYGIRSRDAREFGGSCKQRYAIFIPAKEKDMCKTKATGKAKKKPSKSSVLQQETSAKQLRTYQRETTCNRHGATKSCRLYNQSPLQDYINPNIQRTNAWLMQLTSLIARNYWAKNKTTEDTDSKNNKIMHGTQERQRNHHGGNETYEFVSGVVFVLEEASRTLNIQVEQATLSILEQAALPAVKEEDKVDESAQDEAFLYADSTGPKIPCALLPSFD